MRRYCCIMGVWSAVIGSALVDFFGYKLSTKPASLRHKSFVIVRFLSQQLQEPGVQKELVQADLLLFKYANGLEFMQVCRCRLPLCNSGFHDIIDTAIRLHEYQIDQLAAILLGCCLACELCRLLY